MAKPWHLVGLSLASAAFVLGMSGGAARADLTDPSTLFIGSTACPSGATGTSPCLYLYNGETGATGSGSFDIHMNGSGGPLTDPVLAIFGVPNTSAQPTASIVTGASLGSNSSVSYAAAPTAWNLGSASYSNTTTGLITNQLTSSSGDAYSVLGVQGPVDNSNNWTNWSGADSALYGITPSGFDLYVYGLSPGSDFGSANNNLFVDFNGLPQGSFVIAYGQDSSHIYATPFTQAGIYTASSTTIVGGGSGANVPEPPAALILASGLLGLAALRWWGSRRRLGLSQGH